MRQTRAGRCAPPPRPLPAGFPARPSRGVAPPQAPCEAPFVQRTSAYFSPLPPRRASRRAGKPDSGLSSEVNLAEVGETYPSPLQEAAFLGPSSDWGWGIPHGHTAPTSVICGGERATNEPTFKFSGFLVAVFWASQTNLANVYTCRVRLVETASRPFYTCTVF